MEPKLDTQEILVQELNEVTTVYRKNPQVKSFTFTSAFAVRDAAQAIWPVDINHREAFLAFYLNSANTTVGYQIISIGGIGSCLVDIRVLYQQALLSNATSIIVVHNHPSGNINPSEADIKLTSKIKKAGELLDIRLLDHVIITPEDRFYSFADECLLS